MNTLQYVPPAAFKGLPVGRANNQVALTPEVTALLAENAPVCCSVSGGKDSDAMAIAVSRHLDAIGHTGPRLMIHADLGRVEWRDSLPSCQRLAAALGWELQVVKRQAGDMLSRWQVRWQNNVTRYRDLECVKLILPWSTPSMRFCTSELKTAVIASALKKRFPGQNIVNVVGIRAQESTKRSKMPISAPNTKLTSRTGAGITWNAIIDWEVQDVLATINDAGLVLHEAYVKYGSSRVSCTYCIMGSIADLNAAASCQDNHEIYQAMVELEIESTFAFQERWLADLAPHLLPESLRARVETAKNNALIRARIEAELPEHLLYVSGWPVQLPTFEEAELIASVRQRISTLLGLNARYLTAAEVVNRYAELLAEKRLKSQLKKNRTGAVTPCGTMFQAQLI